ncbi:MAG: hypothetical protein ACRC92_21580 [Peptostreptococcaceae bacterium]
MTISVNVNEALPFVMVGFVVLRFLIKDSKKRSYIRLGLLITVVLLYLLADKIKFAVGITLLEVVLLRIENIRDEYDTTTNNYQ